MRVLYVNPGVQRHGGAERTLTGLLDGLAGTDVEPRVVVFADGDLADHLRGRGVGVVVVPVHGAFRPTARYQGIGGVATAAVAAGPGAWRAVRRIRAEARRFGADVIHTNGTRAHLLAPFLGIPTVATLHDLPQTGLERRVMTTALRRVNTVIANSATVARAFAGVDCRVVDNPVARPRARDRDEARARLGVPADAFVVASLSHFHWYKGQLGLVEAFGRLDAGCHLVLAGGALYGAPSVDYLGQVEEAAATSPARDRIHFAGLQDDVSWVYAAADVVAHCSVRPEPFGMAVVEAILSATPVVASAAGSPGEMLDDGRTALLYPPGDVDALARCLARVRDDPALAASLVAGGRAWAADRFAPARHARQLLDVYQALVPSRRRWLVLTTDFRPMRGGIARLVESVVDRIPAGVDWRCVTVVAGPPETGVFRYDSFAALCGSIPTHVRWLGQGDERRVLCGHPYLQPPAVAASRAARAPLTTIVHGTEIVPQRLAHRAALSLLRFSHRVVAVSRYSAAEVSARAGVADDRLVIVHPLSGSPWTRPDPPPRRADGAGLRLVTVSRLADVHKNIELAIRAVSVLALAGLIDRYLIIGDGPQRAALEELSQALGVDHLVEFLGPLDDADATVVLAGCHLGLFPSRRVGDSFEGFGMVVHELAGAGLPVLVGASGGTPDACPGEWSVLLDPDDLGAWVGRIERLAGDEDERLGLARAAHAWSQTVDPEATVGRYLEVVSRP